MSRTVLSDEEGSRFARGLIGRSDDHGVLVLKASLWLAGAALLCASYAPASAADVSVVVTGAVSNGARVFVAICADKLDTTSCPFGANKVPQAATVKFEFTGVTPSRYAILAFQDTDGTGVLRRSKLGIPLEPFALSNDAGRIGKPTFEAAAVTIGGEGGEFRLNLRTIVHHSEP